MRALRMVTLPTHWGIESLGFENDPRQSEVEGRDRESSFFHECNKEATEAGVHMHRNTLPAYLVLAHFDFHLASYLTPSAEIS